MTNTLILEGFYKEQMVPSVLYKIELKDNSNYIFNLLNDESSNRLSIDEVNLIIEKCNVFIDHIIITEYNWKYTLS